MSRRERAKEARDEAERERDDARLEVAGRAKMLVRGLFVRGLAVAVTELQAAVDREDQAQEALDRAQAELGAAWAQDDTQ